MSRRTAESNKAILAAWNKEQELVLEGKGTREWTPQQQKDILDKGKAYDDDGVAFQGQHMKSAEKYPEYQGDPGNIQFLTREEHLEAHNGNWRNPTNWYFNPITKEKTDFGDGTFIPCEVIQLPEPIVEPSLDIEKVEEKISNRVSETETVTKRQSTVEHIKTSTIDKPKVNPKQRKGIGDRIRDVVDSVVDFSNRHPVLTNIVKGVGVAGVAAVAETVLKGGHSDSGSRSDDYGYKPSNNEYNSSNNTYDDTADDDYSIKRPYTPNDVPAGGQHYHYKDGSIKWKEKPSYHRSGNKDE